MGVILDLLDNIFYILTALAALIVMCELVLIQYRKDERRERQYMDSLRRINLQELPEGRNDEDDEKRNQ